MQQENEHLRTQLASLGNTIQEQRHQIRELEKHQQPISPWALDKELLETRLEVGDQAPNDDELCRHRNIKRKDFKRK